MGWNSEAGNGRKMARPNLAKTKTKTHARFERSHAPFTQPRPSLLFPQGRRTVVTCCSNGWGGMARLDSESAATGGVSQLGCKSRWIYTYFVIYILCMYSSYYLYIFCICIRGKRGTGTIIIIRIGESWAARANQAARAGAHMHIS